MKLLQSLRCRRFVFARMLFLALTVGAIAQIFMGNVLLAVPDSPTTSGSASHEIDPETGKPMVSTPSGLKYVDLVEGTGVAVKTGDHLLVNYEGRLLNGAKFDSSYDRGKPYAFVLGVSFTIPGWTEGFAGMKVGGKRKLIIPPQLGYGQTGGGDVFPPNATLIYTVEIMSVETSSAAKI
jgi:peptidylprolyl isomerase